MLYFILILLWTNFLHKNIFASYEFRIGANSIFFSRWQCVVAPALCIESVIFSQLITQYPPLTYTKFTNLLIPHLDILFCFTECYLYKNQYQPLNHYTIVCLRFYRTNYTSPQWVHSKSNNFFQNFPRN